VGDVLGELAAAAALDRWGRQSPIADLVVPVPPDPRRLRSRGIDHAAAIARGVGRHLGIPVERRVVRRTRAVPRQAGLGAADRARNLEGAFEADVALSGIVALVDDVFTTGATAWCVSRVLASRGASVRVVVGARADRPLPSRTR
jgi:predicted amidophosphoribosyltransferase